MAARIRVEDEARQVRRTIFLAGLILLLAAYVGEALKPWALRKFAPEVGGGAQYGGESR
jgi:small neutral amino acid transporter SnatA (MarC family)